MRILNILVAEDDDQNQAMMKLILSRLGHKIKSAWNGIQALEAVKSGAFDLVFMDIHMPEMDGLETIRQIRLWENNQKHIPIVILTGSIANDMTDEIKKVGADTFLHKPFDIKRITLLVNIIGDQSETKLEQETQLYSNDTLAEAEPLDVNSALARFNGDKNAYRDILKDFLQSLPDRLSALNASLAAGDWNELSRLAHNLKGVSANFGANQLSMLAFQLDEYSRRQEEQAAKNIFVEIESNIHIVLELGQKFVDQQTPNE